MCPTMFSTSCPPEVDPDKLGQVIADGVTGASWPMAAMVALFKPNAEENAEIDRFSWRTGQVPLERAVVYVTALYVEPGDQRPDAAELQVMAFEAATAAVEAEFGHQVALVCVPVVTLEGLQTAWPKALNYFCTTTSGAGEG